MNLHVELRFALAGAEDEGLATFLLARAGRLADRPTRLASCRVAVKPPQGADPTGTRVRVCVEANVLPNHRAASAAEAAGDSHGESARAAARRAFQALERQLGRLGHQSSPE